MVGPQDRFAFEVELLRDDPLEWVVLTGDRRLVSLLGLVALAVVFAVAIGSGVAPLLKETPVLFLLFALVAANFTLIAIVTSLSQFVLNRRLESPGEVRQKLNETVSYREDVGETIGQEIMPVKPDAFFLILFQNARRDIDELGGLLAQTRTKRTRDELRDLTEGLRVEVDAVVELLERPSSGMKHALFASLNTDYENHVHRAWYLQTEYADEFTDRVSGPLSRLSRTLQHIVVASRMFKTTFIESEIAELSRYLLYVGLPVQIGVVVVMLLYTRQGSPPVPYPVLDVLVPTVVTAGFAPFVILSAYVVRLTVVARRTADNFPFSSKLRNTLALRDNYLERSR